MQEGLSELLDQGGLPPPRTESELLQRLRSVEEREYLADEIAALRGLEWAMHQSHLRSLSPNPLGVADIQELHLKAAYYSDKLQPDLGLMPGQFRTRARRVAGEPLVPPFPKDIPVLADRLFDSLALRDNVRDVEGVYRNVAWLHLFFEKIHPFLDFNGRVGRVAVDLLLKQKGLRPVSDWSKEVAKRTNGGKEKKAVEKPYIKAIERTERLRLNRWIGKFKDLKLPKYNGEDIKFGEIGEDYLLPLELHLLSSGVESERHFLGDLQEECAPPMEIVESEARVSQMLQLIDQKEHKLGIIEQHAWNATVEFDVARTLSRNPHSHSLWGQFISPEVK